MANAADGHEYSTLEVNHNAHVYPEVVRTDLPEVAHDPQRYGNYSELPAGGYTLPPAFAELKGNDQYIQTAATPTDGTSPMICGVKRGTFWIVLAVALVVIIGIAVGVPVGLMSGDTQSVNVQSTSGSNSDSGTSSSGTTSAENPLHSQTQLASTNFTDAYGYDNYLLAYQLEDGSVYMSAWNSSKSKWIASRVVDNSEASVANGTSLSLDVFWMGDASPDVHIYWQSPASGGSSVLNSYIFKSSQDISTTSEIPNGGWQTAEGVNNYASIAGGALASYSKTCSFCNQYTYVYWQTAQGMQVATDEGAGWTSSQLIDITQQPATNTSMAQANSWSLGEDDAVEHRSMNVFYRSTTSGLVKMQNGNGMFSSEYLGRDIGADTSIAAFSTGYNETGSEFPSPLGFQIYTVDPDEDNGVQLTYYKGSSWTAADDPVSSLSDCAKYATITANLGRRIYCVVDGSDGLQIMEYEWKGDPSDTSTYSGWGKVGAVSTIPESDS
ncbi:hypothetical protein F4780DRAFT_689977 [Xylariomycetidae sp. FL0641]|nr:hypothetical protein F4780DRAFT_689977 [Xylariomycetidae sp. FL0641]